MGLMRQVRFRMHSLVLLNNGELVMDLVPDDFPSDIGPKGTVVVAPILFKPQKYIFVSCRAQTPLMGTMAAEKSHRYVMTKECLHGMPGDLYRSHRDYPLNLMQGYGCRHIRTSLYHNCPVIEADAGTVSVYIQCRHCMASLSPSEKLSWYFLPPL
jgi:hypothetical protein